MKIKISDVDIVFMSFDEPNAEENFDHLLELAPWSQRSHGVKGFDSAHNAAADLSSTDFFVTVDADTKINVDFLNVEIDVEENHAYNWASKNNVNGCVYSNGGLKLWHKNFIRNMKTHENAIEENKKVDFCWNNNFHSIPIIYSTTYSAASEFQAWRSGFREGIKLLLNNGEPVKNINQIHEKSLSLLKRWITLGTHEENGIWCITGARMGMNYILSYKDFTFISDYDEMNKLWDSLVKDPELYIETTKFKIDNFFNLDVPVFTKDQSKWILQF